MRSPSPKLIEQLAELRLCSPQELADCEAQVSQLCRDLPDFDSVWLDAMVQRRLLTPWQAIQLQHVDGDALSVDDYVCLSKLGRDSFLACDRSMRGQFMLRRVHSVPENAYENIVDQRLHEKSRVSTAAMPVAARLGELIATLKSSGMQAPGSLLLPRTFIESPTYDGLSSDVRSSSGKSCQSKFGWVVSDYAAGWSLEELLIRGGRFPWAVVAEIGRELLTALAWLEARRLLHGDIVLKNVRLTTAGRIVLTDAFVRRLVSPFVMLSQQLSLRDCDGVAPEQISAVRSADIRSEMFSLGCLLWQCLTSRPVVLNADPVARLIRLREHDVIDVRHFVPDCPDWMANTILSMTRRSPELRPSSVEDVFKQWRTESGGSLSQCRTLVKQMPDASKRRQLPVRVRQIDAWPVVAQSLATETTVISGNAASKSRLAVIRKSRPWRKMLTTAVVLMAFVTALMEYGLFPKTLHLGRSPEPLRTADSATSLLDANSGDSANEQLIYKEGHSAESAAVWLWPMPPLNAAGSIQLVAGRHYLAENVVGKGLIQIECIEVDPDPAVQRHPNTAELNTAIVHVPEGRHWAVTADQLMLRGIQLESISISGADKFRLVSSPESSVSQIWTTNIPRMTGSYAGLLTVRAELLVIEKSWITTHALTKDWSCVSWHRPNSASSSPQPMDRSHDQSEILLRDVVMDGTGYGLRLNQPVGSLQLDNVLIGNRVSGIRCDFDTTTSPSLKININRVTQRWGLSMLDVVVRSNRVLPLQVTVVGGESVLAPESALIRLACPSDWSVQNFQASFQLPRRGNAVIVPPSVKPGLWYDTQLSAFIELNQQHVKVDSLLVAEPVFGDQDLHSSTSGSSEMISGSTSLLGAVLSDFEGPKLTAEMPGINPQSIPNYR